MSEETKMTSEETQARLTAAREELDELLEEERKLDGAMHRARLDDVQARVGNAGGIRGAISAAVSKVRGVQDRAEQLPHEVWAARMRVLLLEREHQEVLYEELAEPEARTYAEFKELDAELPKIQRRRQDALDHSVAAGRARREAYNRAQEAGEQLEQLKRTGPES